MNSCEQHNSDDDASEIIPLIKKKKRKKRPARPCLYCSVFQTRLQEHMVRIHGSEPRAIEACQLPKKQRNEAFKLLRAEGIRLFNENEMQKESPNFQRCKSGCSQSKNHKLVMCDLCQAFI